MSAVVPVKWRVSLMDLSLGGMIIGRLLLVLAVLVAIRLGYSRLKRRHKP
jgi:hypothetical protein